MLCLAGYLGECHDLFGTAEKIPHTPEHANISVHKYGTIILILYSIWKLQYKIIVFSCILFELLLCLIKLQQNVYIKEQK